MSSDRDLLKGFGVFEGTDIPERIKKVRERLREEWSDG